MKKAITATIETPRTPNFIHVKFRGNETTVPVNEFTEEELKYVGKKWTEELVKRAKKLSPNQTLR